jgi:hypothetical protein
MIQLMKSLILLIELCILEKRSGEKWLWSIDELPTFSKKIKANVKSHPIDFSFHICFPMLLSVYMSKKMLV